ncbi:MAG: hypothetical protein JJ896_06045 [Rhodothermales bacterium]|nr:hypothetical protein [Rhodothermales bacterium]MBO6779194.1 hypothetical protein [Rhodothermales bacterium]
MRIPVLLTAGLLMVGSASAQTAKTANTLALTDSTAGLDVSLDVVSSFLTGTWHGDGLGGTVDELWTAPAAGQMHGLFRLVRGGAISLSEHMVIDTAAGRPTLRVKHFSSDFEAWEAADEAVLFPLIMADEGALYFDGLTIRRTGDDALTFFLAMGSPDGFREVEINYARVR